MINSIETRTILSATEAGSKYWKRDSKRFVESSPDKLGWLDDGASSRGPRCQSLTDGLISRRPTFFGSCTTWASYFALFPHVSTEARNRGSLSTSPNLAGTTANPSVSNEIQSTSPIRNSHPQYSFSCPHVPLYFFP